MWWGKAITTWVNTVTVAYTMLAPYAFWVEYGKGLSKKERQMEERGIEENRAGEKMIWEAEMELSCGEKTLGR